MRESVILDDQVNLIDDDDDSSVHRCSQVRRYTMPTFFSSPDKSLTNKLLLTPQSNRTIGPQGATKPLLTVQRLPSNRLLDMEDEEIHVQPRLLKQISEDTDEITVLNINQPSYSDGLVISPEVVEEQKSQPLSFIEYNLDRFSALPLQQPLLTDPVEGEDPSNLDDEQRHSLDQVTFSDGGGLEDTFGKLDSLITKVEQTGIQTEETTTAQLHQQHFNQTIQALEHIRSGFQEPPSVAVLQQYFGELVYLPEPWFPEQQKKVAIFDMDETLIHCVDDIENDNPDVVLEIDFSPDGNGTVLEDIVCAGINIRPYWRECLEEAAKSFQVVVFTASHQTYADAILNHLDPTNTLFQYRLYRQHCYLTPEKYYVKDLRIIANRNLKDLVLIDNSVYSFAYQLANGIPIVSFYKEPPFDEEMLHLIYYMKCLAGVEDVRVQNRQAFELDKLAGVESVTEQEKQTGIHEIIEEEGEDEEYNI